MVSQRAVDEEKTLAAPAAYRANLTHHLEAKMTGTRAPLPLLYTAWTHTRRPDGQWVDRRHAVREGDRGVAVCRGQLSTTPGAERWWDRSRHEAQDCLSCYAAVEHLAEATTGVRV